jgi:hypothetical protein
MVRQWFRHAFANLETGEDECSISSVTKGFAAANHDMREILVLLAESDAFRYRRPLPIEGGTP